ncbi:MAG TPA: hypothetical protein VGH93_00105 [Solirubrobacteraceae bacterium]
MDSAEYLESLLRERALRHGARLQVGLTGAGLWRAVLIANGDGPSVFLQSASSDEREVALGSLYAQGEPDRRQPR